MKRGKGFIYIWYDKKKKKYYIGSHMGLENDGYVCSSTWMRNAYRRRPNDFKRRIIKRMYDVTRTQLFHEENKWLGFIKQTELGKKYYNLINSTSEREPHLHSLVCKSKLSLLAKQRFLDPVFRKRHSEATKQGMTVEIRLHLRNVNKRIPWNKGLKLPKERCIFWCKPKNFSAETKKKIAKNLPDRSGVVHSELSKQKMSDAHRGQLAWNKGIPMKDESKQKLKSSLAIWYSDDSNRKMISEKTKLAMTPEICQKISIAKQGKKRHPMSDETKQKIAASKKGRKFPKLSAAMVGRKLSSNHVENIRAARYGNTNAKDAANRRKQNLGALG